MSELALLAFHHHLLYPAAAVTSARETFLHLLAAYSEPHRRYHTLEHIKACLLTANALPQFHAERDRDAALALWWHDCVYDPMAHDNEARSAQRFAELGGHGLEPATVERVQACILATSHKETPSGPLERYVCDVDLSVLGATPAEYDAYVRNVRAEYPHVSHEAWRVGRSAVLHGLLARKTIYQLEDFREVYEARARLNMLGELAELEAIHV
jgi:predicted metal-dependent HD superfamily phosphohydrolase